MTVGPEKPTETDTSATDSSAEEIHRKARRAFLTGSLATVPVITTLASQPAWARGCGRISVMASIHSASNRPRTRWCYGRPPRYWRRRPYKVARHIAHVGLPNPREWDNLSNIPSPYDYTYAHIDDLEDLPTGSNWSWRQKVEQYKWWLRHTGGGYPEYPFGTKFNYIFGHYADDDLSLMQCLYRDDLPLLCHTACAWLNACEYGKDGFGYTPDEVVEYFQTTGMQDPNLLIAAFTEMNSASESA